ncbi:lysophospholipid acyltransferase [Lobaria immixta]|nr:lysophospholipid acyltransferase [Lobaria immixta]
MLPYINIPFEYGSSLTGSSVDELKLITSFILSYPLAGVLKRIPDAKPYQKNLFIITVSLFYLVGLFDLWSGIRTLLVSSAGAYLIASRVEGHFMPWIGFVFVMGHMSVNQLNRQFANAPDKVDITGAQMVLVMKLTAFCWNVQDGRLPPKDLADFQRERALTQLPSVLDFAGYVLFFPSLFAGPSFDYVDYRRWIETTMFEVPPGTDPASRPRTRKKRKIPRSGTPAAMKAAMGGVWIFLFLKFSVWYNADLVLSDQYVQYGFFRRVWILQMLGFSTRMKYYGVWYLTEGACILSGMGYKGIETKTGRVRWNRLQNVNPWGIETAQNSRAYLENWNMNTNNWLRNYMYLRVTPKGKKPGFRASLATFVTSAVWHGFYPGYYLSFILAAFLQTVAKNFRRYVRPFFLTPDGQRPTPYKIYYDVVCYFTTQVAFCFTTAPFVLLTLPTSLLVWSRVYFYAVIGTAASMALFASPAKPQLIRKLHARNQPALQRAAAATAAAIEQERKDKWRYGDYRDGEEHPLMGLPSDPGRDVDEVVREIREEVEARRGKGRAGRLPTGAEMKAAVEDKLG